MVGIKPIPKDKRGVGNTGAFVHPNISQKTLCKMMKKHIALFTTILHQIV
jgi:hypothetical protein